jgi:hypothetical protein
MTCMDKQTQFALLACALAATLLAPSSLAAQSFALDSTKGLQPQGVLISPVTYQGRKAVKVISSPESDAAWAAQKSGTGGGIVILPGTSFHNGTIEIDVSGQPGAGAPVDARGFVGMGFRLTPDAAKYECVYIRPTNGRADDQLRRNHSTQYSSVPDYEWFRLRTESPGKYESYVDLEPGVWTHLKIEVDGVKMRFYVNGASQPTLLVNDLKLGDTTGPVALWIGPGTEAYFANLRITK